MDQITLIKTNYWNHVSMDLYNEFEKCIAENTDWKIIEGISELQYQLLKYASKIIPPFQIPYNTGKNFMMVGYQGEKFFPYFYFKANKKILWMYDAWEPLFPVIKKM